MKQYQAYEAYGSKVIYLGRSQNRVEITRPNLRAAQMITGWTMTPGEHLWIFWNDAGQMWLDSWGYDTCEDKAVEI